MVEAGKRYTYKNNGSIYLCIAVHRGAAFMYDENSNQHLIHYRPENYTELLTFGDLKKGDKFRHPYSSTVFMKVKLRPAVTDFEYGSLSIEDHQVWNTSDNSIVEKV